MEQVDQFVADQSTNAWDKAAEQLLSSPHYGEHWARMWLDLARYADSHGYEKDPGRKMWLYRDWVIEAFNQNMKLDQFTIEQIAGDMLPEATVKQRSPAASIATPCSIPKAAWTRKSREWKPSWTA